MLIVYRTEKKVFSQKNHKRKLNKMKQKQAKKIEYQDFLRKSSQTKGWDGLKTKIYDEATKRIINVTVRCNGERHTFSWKLICLEMKADIFCTTEDIKDILSRNGLDKPWFKIFLGKVLFTDNPPRFLRKE